MALIFAYDALAGERERGTLRLVLTHPVSRGQILLAKYISAMLCLLAPLLMSLLLAVILLTTSTVARVSATRLGRPSLSGVRAWFRKRWLALPPSESQEHLANLLCLRSEVGKETFAGNTNLSL